jgi:hypothetical protein
MSQEQPPPLPDGRGGWIHDTPRPTSPPPPRRTDRPRVIRDVGQAVAIESGLGDLDTAVRKLKKAGLSWDEIHNAFYKAIRDSWD